MTVETIYSRTDHTGDGVETVFSYDFKIFSNEDLVLISASPDGTETTLVLNTDYTVSGAGDIDGGSVTLNEPIASGHQLIILRELDLVQGTDLRNQGAFYAETHEDTFDRLVMVVQQLQEQIDRTAKVSVSSQQSIDQLIADFESISNQFDQISPISRITYKYSATNGQTVFSGLDDNGSTLSFTFGYEDVFVNGVLLNPDEYTADDTTGEITLNDSLLLGDVVNIVSYGTVC